MKQFSISVEEEILARLDALRSDGQGKRSRNVIINDALDLYLDLYNWQIEHITQGLSEANRDSFVPQTDMDAFFDKVEKQK